MNRAALVEAFAAYPDRLATAAAATDPSSLPTGEWGPHEIVRHLVAVEAEVWTARLAQVAAVDDPQWSWTEPGPAAELAHRPLAVALEAFATARAANVAAVAALDDDGWARSGTHATYGRLDVEGLLRLAIEHDEDHISGLGPVPVD